MRGLRLRPEPTSGSPHMELSAGHAARRDEVINEMYVARHRAAVEARRGNNFDFLRQLAAFFVIYGHSLALLGVAPPVFWDMNISTFGVAIFFVLSGYLVTQSWRRDPRLLPFLSKRSLRIFPALLVCVTLTAVVLGPLMTSLPLLDYFGDPAFRRYFYNFLLHIHYFLPAVFADNPWPNAVNGSLWSLPVEFFCYLAVLGLAAAGAMRRPFRLAAATAVAAIGGLVLIHAYDGPQIVVYATDLRSAMQIIPYFLVGAIVAAAPGLPLRRDAALGVAFALTAAEHLLPSVAFQAVGYLGIPYVVLACGTAATPGLARAGRWGDVSYGMYLYAFPVQQALIAVTQAAIPPAALIIATTAVSVTLAWASWHLVEKPCLSLKPRAPAALPTADDPGAAATRGRRLPALSRPFTCCC